MSYMAGVLSIKYMSCLLFANTCMVHPRFLGSVLLIIFLISFCYVCLRLVACVLKDASISVLPILD
jgi:hypothetical protein